ncbi:acylneuraminate cytidylyltransferase [Agrobacterium rosae]|uniref:acylneuraminate cytidylyltransferase n=1 Tax=Agrobacterium rosae TaxID=1972867 RepID=UPI0020332025|nr:acylneuraminate cytidylyltransferase [Agrobacterium rosae]MCM2435385.1 acylneuraminate cytidylyltransferase [Agrobacterium rosae]
MDIVAIIPARGGSIGLPRKNIKTFNGLPLVSRSITAALNAETVSQVYVSSDDSEILLIAERYGALGVVRPEDISGPTASSESALIHALAEIEAQTGKCPDIIVFLQCTSPFTTSAHIDAVVNQLLTSNADSAFAAIEDHGFIWEVATDGTAAGITHDHTKPRQRRQDMTPRYRESGAVYAMRVKPFLEKGNRFCGKTILVPVDMPSVEIDTIEDWHIAENYAKTHDALENPPAHAGEIKALITDFDGVHTDDRVLVNQDGSESVTCSRSDGMGIERLRGAGTKLLILSRESNTVVTVRAQKLKMEVMHHVTEKLPVLDSWRQENGLEWSEIAYIGNDINDVDCMEACGLSFCPSDAHETAKNVADKVLDKAGGHGALRELSDYLISHSIVQAQG